MESVVPLKSNHTDIKEKHFIEHRTEEYEYLGAE